MASRGLVFELESVWGWQIGSVSFPPLLSLEELFSINYRYIDFLKFFFKCPSYVEPVRCNCGLLVPWRVSPWMAGWAGGFSLLGQGRSEVLPVLPGLFLLLLLMPGQVQDNLRELYAKCRFRWRKLFLKNFEDDLTGSSVSISCWLHTV